MKSNRQLAVWLLLWLAQSAMGQPAQVILLRHAEKSDDPADVHLTARGRERAQALVALLGRGSKLTRDAPVAALYATRITKHDHSYRTGETLAPSGQDLSLPVDTRYETDEYRRLAVAVMSQPAYHGKTVIICWTHHNMAQFAAALGVSPPPPAWKNKVFDRLWVITWAGAQAEWRELPQRLLPGDTNR